MQYRLVIAFETDADVDRVREAERAPEVLEAAYNFVDALVRAPSLVGYRRVRMFGTDGNQYLAGAFKQ